MNSFEHSRIPLVSIGMPVYNGENYLRVAIESILNQTFEDFELIICDNASTDLTSIICEEFANRDPRIKYIRNKTNLGAAPNHDLCFHKSRGYYFKWAAHDDLIEKEFLEKSVNAMKVDPEAVLCVTAIREIEDAGKTTRTYSPELPDLDSKIPSKRFAAIINNRHNCTYFYGLFRRTAMIGTQLHGNHIGSDRVLLAEMALRGPFIELEEPLLVNRVHAKQYSSTIFYNPEKAANWVDRSRGSNKSRFWRNDLPPLG